MKRRWPHGAAGLCLLLFSLQAFTSLKQDSATWDETHYFGLGKYLIEHRSWNVAGSILHPPLSYYIHSIPWLLFDTDPEPWRPLAPEDASLEALGGVDGSDTIRGQVLLSSAANRGDRLLTASRLMMVLTAMLLGWFVYRWSFDLHGARGALLATMLFSFCPNVLAHARLITPDIVLTTFSFLTLYSLWRMLGNGRLAPALIGGVCLGLSLLSKFTGVLLVPISVLLIAAWWIRRSRPSPARVALFFAAGFVVLLLGYGMDLSPYVQGIQFQRQIAASGHSSFLLGRYSENGWWHYILVCFVLKTPIATLLLLFVATVALARTGHVCARIDALFLVLPALVVVAFFCVHHQATGLRYILPVYPLLFVLAGGAVEPLRAGPGRRAALAVLCAWYVGASLYIHPHYLAYFNELGGGPSQGYRYLVDSNLDWGQDLKRLRKYMEEHNIPRIKLSYFGSDSPERYAIEYDWLPSLVLKNPHPEAPPQRLSREGWFAISATNLQGVYFPNKNLFAWLKERKPEAQLGYATFLYHVEDGELR